MTPTDPLPPNTATPVQPTLADAFFEQLPAAACVKDEQGRYLYVNREWARALGRPVGDWIGRCNDEVLAEELRRPFALHEGAVWSTGEPMETVETIDGQRQWMILRFLFEREGRRLLGVLASDVTERRRLQSAARQSDRRYRELVETMGVGLALVDRDEVFLYVNDRFCDMIGYDRTEILGRRPQDFLDAPSRRILEARREQPMDDRASSYELTWIHRDRRTVPTIVSGQAVLDESGKEIGSFAVVTDISERKRIEEALLESQRNLERTNRELERLSTLDGLTGIPNRRAFDNRFHLEWRRAARERGPIGFIMIDIDDFKAYNDAYGHLAGDECLRSVARVLSETVQRPADFVARFGGEEFVILLPWTEAGGAVQLAEDLRRRVEQIGIRHERSRSGPVVTISLGVAVARPAPGEDGQRLIAAADRALYQAKQGGRNRVSLADGLVEEASA